MRHKQAQGGGRAMLAEPRGWPVRVAWCAIPLTPAQPRRKIA